MLLNKIKKNNIVYVLYKTKDADLNWFTFPTTDKNRVIYSIREDGVVLTTTKKTYKERIIIPTMVNNVLVVGINRKLYKVKNLVAKCFIKGYHDGLCVLLKDGNPYNCHVENLIVCDKKKSGEIFGGLANSKPIKVNGIEYKSIIDFCKKNYIGQRTFYDKKQGKYKKTLLDNFLIEYMD